MIIAGMMKWHEGEERKIRIGIGELLGADFATATVLISFGVILGRLIY